MLVGEYLRAADALGVGGFKRRGDRPLNSEGPVSRAARARSSQTVLGRPPGVQIEIGCGVNGTVDVSHHVETLSPARLLNAARDRGLLQSCISILDQCLALSPDVGERFDEVA